MANSLKAVSDATFQTEILNKPGVHLVDFWAEWCPPCKALEPSLTALQKTYEGKVSFAQVNADENPDVAATYGVRSLPTLFLFRDGRVVDQIVGALPKAALDARISRALER